MMKLKEIEEFVRKHLVSIIIVIMVFSSYKWMVFKKNDELNLKSLELEKQSIIIEQEQKKVNAIKQKLFASQEEIEKERKKLNQEITQIEKEKKLHEQISKLISDYSDIDPNVIYALDKDYKTKYREQQTTLDLIEALSKELKLHEEYKELVENRRPHKVDTIYPAFGSMINIVKE